MRCGSSEQDHRHEFTGMRASLPVIVQAHLWAHPLLRLIFVALSSFLACLDALCLMDFIRFTTEWEGALGWG